MREISVLLVLAVPACFALPGLLEGSGYEDYDVVESVRSTGNPYVPPDDEILDPIASEDGIYPEDDTDYELNVVESAEAVLQNSSEVSHSAGMLDSTGGPGPVKFNLLENFEFDAAKTVNESEVDSRAVEPEVTSCSGFQKLAVQPTFVNSTFSVIRKCCPAGQSLQFGDKGAGGARCQPGEPWGPPVVEVINAQIYDLCIEDLEQPAPPLGRVYGNPCPVGSDLLKYGTDTQDSLYVIQNGSLLVINEQADSCSIFNGYCLDVNRATGAMSGYVCYSEAQWLPMGDIFKGQMLALALCLIFAIPLLLATAYFYVAIPEFNDIHGKALSLNCVNFAIALLLESIFQHKTKGNGSTDDTIVLANYAEYFILATFFWLLVNCMNNCIHAWYFLPKGIQIKMRGEKRAFALYAACAQLIPLAIILLNPPHADHTAVKHYFFIPIIVIISLNMLSFVITFWGFQRVNDILIQHYIMRGRLSGTTSGDAHLANLPNIRTADVERVRYMTKYTAMLFVVMAGVWSITIGTYYTTRTIPILYDILFGLQGILIFIIFICLPRPFRTVKAWFQRNQYCGCRHDPDEVDLRRHGHSYRVSHTSNNNGTKEAVPLNNVTS